MNEISFWQFQLRRWKLLHDDKIIKQKKNKIKWKVSSLSTSQEKKLLKIRFFFFSLAPRISSKVMMGRHRCHHHVNSPFLVEKFMQIPTKDGNKKRLNNLNFKDFHNFSSHFVSFGIQGKYFWCYKIYLSY